MDITDITRTVKQPKWKPEAEIQVDMNNIVSWINGELSKSHIARS